MVKIYAKKVRKIMQDTGCNALIAMAAIPVPKKWWDQVLEEVRNG